MSANLQLVDVTHLVESKPEIDACKVCAHALSAVAGVDVPTPGSIVLCSYCGALYAVGDDLGYQLIEGEARDILLEANPYVRIAVTIRARAAAGEVLEETEEDPVDLAELARLAGPVREELVQARIKVSQLICACNDMDATLESRAAARAALRSARSHRDVLRRLLLAVQTYLDAEGGA